MSDTIMTEIGLMLKVGTIVVATIIAIPTFTKTQDRGRGPEMHLTKMGHIWFFGMKVLPAWGPNRV